MTTPGQRIAGFDGIRAIAVLMVFCGHQMPGGAAHFMGGFGVHIFFVLSGFLIVGSLYRDRLDIADGRQTRAAAWRRFQIRRAARIFPLYYALLAMIGVVSCVRYVPQFAGVRPLVYGLFLTNIYIGQTRQWLEPVTHIWSLAVEEQFYLLVAPAILLLPARHARSLCAMVVAFSSVCSIRLMSQGEEGLVYVSSATNFGLIAMGGVVALRAGVSPPHLSRRLQPLLIGALLLIPFLGRIWIENPMLRQIAQPLLAALLLAEMRDCQRSRVVQVLEWRALAHIGRVSYGFYLLHPLINADTVRLATGGVVELAALPDAVAAMVLLLVALAAASASWSWFERPILLLARRAIRERPDMPARERGHVMLQRKLAASEMPMMRGSL